MDGVLSLQDGEGQSFITNKNLYLSGCLSVRLSISSPTGLLAVFLGRILTRSTAVIKNFPKPQTDRQLFREQQDYSGARDTGCPDLHQLVPRSAEPQMLTPGWEEPVGLTQKRMNRIFFP